MNSIKICKKKKRNIKLMNTPWMDKFLMINFKSQKKEEKKSGKLVGKNNKKK